ncbi:MAG: hypothetical protein KC635_03640 [Myxococcales bacterium]|nr:hypothetical protein [Myxococcales bacterium]MCB9734788.1 hypothetical protein [Deltaproteobacteria bacterium]
MTKKIRLLVLALVVSLFASTTACNRYGWQLFGDVVETAVAAAIVVAVLSHHDHHYHSYRCGHRYVMVESRPVYYYDGHWEYYDSYSGRWYYYPDGPPGY